MLDGRSEPGKHVPAVEGVVCFQHFNLPGRTVDVDHPGFGLHQPDQAGSGSEVIDNLCVDVGEAIRRRDHFDGEIGGERPVACGDAGFGNTAACDEGGIRSANDVGIPLEDESGLGAAAETEGVSGHKLLNEMSDESSDDPVFGSGWRHSNDLSSNEFTSTAVVR